MATNPLSRPSAAILALHTSSHRAYALGLLGYAADREEDDGRLIGDVADPVLHVHEQPVAAGAQLARVQPAVELQGVRAGDDVAVEARADGLVAALDE